MRAVGLSIGLLLSASLVVAGGPADRHQEILKKMLVTLDDLTKTLVEVRDEASAQKAVDDLKKNAKVFIELRKKAAELPPPSPEEKAKVAKEYLPKLDENVRKLLNEVQRVQLLPSARFLLFELKGVFQPEKKSG